MTDNQSNKPSFWDRFDAAFANRADRKAKKARLRAARERQREHRANEQATRPIGTVGSGASHTGYTDPYPDPQVPPDPNRKSRPMTVNQNATPKRRGGVIALAVILVLVLLGALTFSASVVLPNLVNDQARSAIDDAERRATDEVNKANAAKDTAETKLKEAEAKTAAAQKKAEEADALAKKRAEEIENLRKQTPGTATPGGPTNVGNGDGTNAQPGTTPADVVTAEQMTAAIKQLKAGGLDPKNGTFTVNWAKNDALQAGAMEFCEAPAHTASALVERLKTCPLAMSTYMDGAGVTQAQALDAKAWVPWQSNERLHYAKGMSFDNNGNVEWGKDFVDPEGAVLWINTHATKPFFLRDRCLNGTHPPVATKQQPTFAPIVKQAPPVTTIVNVPPVVTIVHNPPKKDVPPAVIKYCKPGIPVGDKRCEDRPKECKPGIPVGDDRCDAKDPAKNPEFPADHDLAKGDTPVTAAPKPLPNPIDPAKPITAPAEPVVTAPGADPAPIAAPVPAPEAPAPAPAAPGQAFTDPDSAVPAAAPAAASAVPAAAPVAAAPVVSAPAATAVVAPAPAQAAPAASTPVTAEPAPVLTQVATVDATPSDAGTAAASVETAVG